MSGTDRAGGEGEETALDESWLREIVQKADHAEWKARDYNKGSPTILRVPDNILATKPEAYKPKIISLGPFHHRRLQEWDDRIKWPYLNRFVSRNPHLRLPDYIKEIKALEQEARSAYPKPLEMDSNEFAEMMLLDCCFVLEFLLLEHPKMNEADPNRKDKAQQKQQWWQVLPQQQHHQQQQQQQQPEVDPITCMGKWALPLIRHDIVILENQLPLFLLRSLFEKAADSSSALRSIEFEDLVLNFFHNFSLFPAAIQKTSDITKFIKEKPCNHFLHFFHNCMGPWTQPEDDHLPDRLPTIRCARELREAKVKLVKKDAPRVLDIGFRKPRFYDVANLWSGQLEIPQLSVDDDTDTLFRNLIAFEQCFPEVGDHVSAYASFMDLIVDNKGDVALLRQKDIVVNWLGSDKDVAQLFNQLCKEMTIDLKSCCMGKLVIDVAKHCEKPWNRCWASFKHSYFSNPWAGISVAAAIILFVLTFLQTLYTILGYQKQTGN